MKKIDAFTMAGIAYGLGLMDSDGDIEKMGTFLGTFGAFDDEETEDADYIPGDEE